MCQIRPTTASLRSGLPITSVAPDWIANAKWLRSSRADVRTTGRRGRLRLRLDHARDVEAVHPGQLHVHEEEVDRVLQEPLERLGAVLGLERPAAVAAEEVGERLASLRVALDERG